MTKLAQVRAAPLIYMMMVYKVNDNNKDVIQNVDQYDDYLPLVNDPDLYKLIH